jgi:hypothetical protein
MSTLIHSVSLSMGLHMCCLEFLAFFQVWLCSRMSKSLSLGDALALIKHRFYVLICQVNVWNNHVYTLSTNLVPQLYCLFDFRNIGAKLEHFKKSQGNWKFHQNKCHPGMYVTRGDRVQRSLTSGPRGWPANQIPWPADQLLSGIRPKLLGCVSTREGKGYDHGESWWRPNSLVSRPCG